MNISALGEGSNWNKRILTLYRCVFVSETKNRKSNFMMILWFYDIMIVSKICEYLGSRLKVPTEINGFLVSIIASLYQRPKIENQILWWFYDIMRNLWISRPSVEGSNWNKRIPTLYRCLFVSETKNRKSNFMMILWFYDIMILW